jgi:flagellar hook-associated protein 2
VATVGILVNSAVNSVNSGNLHRRDLSETTRLSSLNGGRGVARGTLKISDTTGSTATLNLASDGIQTVGDVLLEIERLGLAVDARINDDGDGILLVDTAQGAFTMRVAEGGSSTAADLHLLGDAVEVQLGGQPTKVINGTTTFRVLVDADDTLVDLVQKLNDANAGLTAAQFNDPASSEPFRLSLFSHQGGTAGDLLVDTSQLGLSFEETVPGRDALLQFGGATGTLLASSENRFSDVLPGLRLAVADVFE